MSKKQYEERKAKGICVKCGKADAINGVMCVDCKTKTASYSREVREYCKKLKICPRCKNNKLAGNEKTCPECLAKNKSNYSYSTEWYRKDISRLKALGVCRGCRKRSVAVGKTYCSICLAKRREKRKQTPNHIDRSIRVSLGLCYRCGKELDRNGSVCTACAESLINNLSQRRA